MSTVESVAGTIFRLCSFNWPSTASWPNILIEKRWLTTYVPASASVLSFATTRCFGCSFSSLPHETVTHALAASNKAAPKAANLNWICIIEVFVVNYSGAKLREVHCNDNPHLLGYSVSSAHQLPTAASSFTLVHKLRTVLAVFRRASHNSGKSLHLSMTVAAYEKSASLS